MSNQPNQQFYVDDKVIDTQRGFMGIVTWSEWTPVRHDYTYEFTCTFVTDKLEDLRADSIWFKVVDTSTPKYALGCDLEAAVNYPVSG